MSIYLDNAATTKPLDSIASVYARYESENWYNPSARYAPAAHEAVTLDDARKKVSDLAFPGAEVIFTASGTESNNTVIFSGIRKNRTMHMVTDNAEHAAVYESMMRQRDNGIDVTFVDTDSHGNVSADSIVNAMRDDTCLVSVMHVNNETGAVNDIEGISRAVKNRNGNTLFHSDGVQAFGRVFVRDFSAIDYYTVSAHKIHALKGTGAVLYKKGSPLKPYIHGGGQERGLRSGTENTFGIYAMSEAAGYFNDHRNEIAHKLKKLREVFLSTVKGYDGVSMISPENGADHILSISIKNVRGEVLLHSLEEDGIYISTGSACSSKGGVSRTAKSLGLSKQTAEGIVRISFSPFNTEEEAVYAAERLIFRAEMLCAYTRR